MGFITSNVLQDTQPLPSTSDPPPSAALPPSNQPIWAQSVDSHLFSTLAAHLAASPVPLSISELANALLMPTTDQGIPTQHPSQSESGSGSITSPMVSSNMEIMETEESREQDEEPLEAEASRMRVCSVRACKQTVPGWLSFFRFKTFY